MRCCSSVVDGTVFENIVVTEEVLSEVFSLIVSLTLSIVCENFNRVREYLEKRERRERF